MQLLCTAGSAKVSADSLPVVCCQMAMFPRALHCCRGRHCVRQHHAGGCGHPGGQGAPKVGVGAVCRAQCADVWLRGGCITREDVTADWWSRRSKGGEGYRRRHQMEALVEGPGLLGAKACRLALPRHALPLTHSPPSTSHYPGAAMRPMARCCQLWTAQRCRASSSRSSSCEHLHATIDVHRTHFLLIFSSEPPPQAELVHLNCAMPTQRVGVTTTHDIQRNGCNGRTWQLRAREKETDSLRRRQRRPIPALLRWWRRWAAPALLRRWRRGAAPALLLRRGRGAAPALLRWWRRLVLVLGRRRVHATCKGGVKPAEGDTSAQ